MENKLNLPLFKPCESKPNVVANVLFVFILGGLGLVIISMLSYAVIWLFTPDKEPVILKISIVLITVILAGLIIFLFVYLQKSYGHTGIIIDETGIIYYYRDKNHIVKQVPWTAFCKNPNEEAGQPLHDVNDFVLGYKSRVKMLQWWMMKDEKVDVESDSFGAAGHSFHFIYLNRFTLISTFLLGLAHFRPDLSVNPSVFSAFYIHRNEYVFKRKSYMRDALLAFFILAVIALVIYWLTKS
ncbi:hypothetical protein [Pedobacter caeni]|uniref:Uncharacterized protein n=1 Tax=Pedobacter caeni TaxID=288992 RepID=A0A1M5BYQ2_9SPHI|nr:hypothetical protein [Pedobacter caeni]SHF47644.1 hypothetical protein SAMN04488522_1021416 [Pedobacter caeni]